MEAKSKVCTICGRQFANGKAMGGHLRAHLAKLPLPAPRAEPSQSPTTLQSANSELSFIATASVHNDREIADSGRITVNLPKRDRQSADPPSVEVAEQFSSVSSEAASSEKDVAKCLLLLSVENTASGSAAPSEAIDDETSSDEDMDDETFCVHRERIRSRARYRCRVCKKIFGSTLALSRHTARHHQQGSNSGEADRRDPESSKRIFKCPYCGKVFESGQGLGGHKKVHFLNASKKQKSIGDDLNLPPPPDAAAEMCAPRRLFNIDLNLPPPPEDQDDE